VSGVYYAGYVMATPVLTSLTDRVDARRVYLFACLRSCVGAAGFMLFAGGLASALVFQFLIGAGLDLAGGNRSLLAWGLAFASIGIFGVLAPLARLLYARRR
jgi:Na+/melibiose symporter-like transporter